ncbi:hypothetical protein H0H87_010217 [Tephrocybe sp. NHM501043]|nr:hypothetical protein H0H87_010217 [Tephrocybe sp. NHM501043]
MDRRIRHITAIQVHNLTPFPARDSFASALAQPAEQPQFTGHGSLADDLDVTVQRRRSRRISGNSHQSMRSEDGLRNEGSPVGGTLVERSRRTSGNRVNFPAEGPDHRPMSSSGSAPKMRPHRARTGSMVSSISSHISGAPFSISQVPSTSVVSPSFGAMFPDNSQAELERVIQSRLVESFITITVLDSSPSKDLPSTIIPPAKPSPSHHDKATPSNAEASPTRKGIKASPLSPLDRAISKPRRESDIPSRPARPPLSHVKSASASTSRSTISRPNGEAKRTPSQIQAAVPNSLPKNTILTPQYFSPIHRPSTHPYFLIDQNLDSIAQADCSGSRLKIEVWGKIDPEWHHKIAGKGKEKQTERLDPDVEWKILQERVLDLQDLVPLSDSSIIQPSHLPSNSLLITLSPPGETFYAQTPTSSRRRSLSPAIGYVSDPETDQRSVKPVELLSTSMNGSGEGQTDHRVTASRRRHRAFGASTPLTSQQDAPATTAGWQDLLKLVTLQSCILDNESSLAEVVREIDKVLESDITFTQCREISERESRLEELAVNRKKVIEGSDNLRNKLQARREEIRQRKQMLRLARVQLQRDVEAEFTLEEEMIQDRAQHSSLCARFSPTRTTLIGILSSIYPIDLLSPPDLLYTILDVPLPIPLSSSDPAPPLTLSSHKDVNEDSVATALGYAAQVIQLLSAYLGKSLVYPVTCIGSRSLIRDNISAMVGPRMFPLYSKGVDTYRFEYGVFLLNKDIELLMADRDLRALDMRHTLPNLKNLLLTLTDGEGATLQQTRPPDSPMSLASELELASRAESPADPNSTTPKASTSAILEGSTPPASGATTPTTAPMSDATKKARPFLAFSPLTDFLRGRYPSSSRISIKNDAHAEEPQSEERSVIGPIPDNGSDDEDRKTISGASQSGEGDTTSALIGRTEKLDDESQSPAKLTPPLPLTTVVR